LPVLAGAVLTDLLLVLPALPSGCLEAVAWESDLLLWLLPDERLDALSG